MDHQQLFYSSQALLQPNDAFGPIIGSFDQGLDNFMFPYAGFIDSVSDSGMVLPLDAVMNVEEEEEEKSRERNSSGGTSSGASTKPKKDRSKTLVSERKRRSRMKETLYELRSLVPNITKVSFISTLELIHFLHFS